MRCVSLQAFGSWSRGKLQSYRLKLHHSETFMLTSQGLSKRWHDNRHFLIDSKVIEKQRHSEEE